MPDTIELSVSVEQLQEYVESRRASLVDVLAGRIDATNASFADWVKGNLTGGVLQQRSGKLLSTVMQEPAQLDGETLYGAVTAGGDLAPYGIYFEEGGTGYYEIRPINARVLAFMSGGQQLFARVVNHPPIPHLPWFGPEVITGTQEMTQSLNEGIAEVLES